MRLPVNQTKQKLPVFVQQPCSSLGLCLKVAFTETQLHPHNDVCVCVCVRARGYGVILLRSLLSFCMSLISFFLGPFCSSFTAPAGVISLIQ